MSCARAIYRGCLSTSRTPGTLRIESSPHYALCDGETATSNNWSLEQDIFTVGETDAATLAAMQAGPLGRLQLLPLYHILPKSDHAGFVEQYSNRIFSGFTNEEYESTHGKISMFVSLNKTTGTYVDRNRRSLSGSLWIYNFVGYGGKSFGQVPRFIPASNNITYTGSVARFQQEKQHTAIPKSMTTTLPLEQVCTRLGPCTPNPVSMSTLSSCELMQFDSATTPSDALDSTDALDPRLDLFQIAIATEPDIPQSFESRAQSSDLSKPYNCASIDGSAMVVGFMPEPQVNSVNGMFALQNATHVPWPVCTSGNTLQPMHKLRPDVSYNHSLQEISQTPFSQFTLSDLARLSNQEATQLALRGQLSSAQMFTSSPHNLTQIHAEVDVEASRYFLNFGRENENLSNRIL